MPNLVPHKFPICRLHNRPSLRTIEKKYTQTTVAFFDYGLKKIWHAFVVFIYMNSSTLHILGSEQELDVIPARRLHAIRNRKANRHTTEATVIKITENVETSNAPKVQIGLNGWVMPPIINPYFRGRDNDPL